MKVVWKDVPGTQRTEDHFVREIDCGAFYLTLHEYEAGWTDNQHQHPEAQSGYILKGSMTISIEGGEVIEQKAGQSVYVRSMVPHSSAAAGEKTVALNIYVKPTESMEV